ncbi:PREDICTED: uncharacterized protein LOC105556642 [Vollenhovia emeryi]|uniref:uncharacterized protein LOC105556642 n=1 Tax=Vollenhovia emeryi TaxID=411798 RepID=UPI0005F366EB|nr:PREDICTED: uncharacterized protein LOC105556642 [Vollenhovia emeryi]
MANRRVYSGKKGSRMNNNRTQDRPIGKRKPINRFCTERETESVSTSAKKLRMAARDYEIHVDQSFGYRLIEFMSVFAAIAQLVVCKKCGSEVRFAEASVRGLGFKIAVSCDGCVTSYINSCPLIRNAYEINRRLTFAMRLIGIGANGIAKFCAFMCLPNPIFRSFYNSVIDAISIATEAVRCMSMKKAAAEEKQLSDQDGQKNGITVSGDGTWKTRGFSSLLGVTTLIGWRTGKVVDLQVKSKFCKACDGRKDQEGTAEFEEWYETHKDKCQRNHEGSSGKMEVDSVEMFERSETLHDTNRSKKECIDHVQKRLGRQLRQLVKKTRGLGGKSKLTGKLIDELSIYYGLAIRRNTKSVENMKKEIWATLHHKISTDLKPQHEKCPQGADSWCTWQRAKASGQLADYQHKPAMRQEIFNALRPVYEELTRDDLLQRCLGGYTQNNNECFNSTLWSMAPKTVNTGKKIVDIAADLATCNFNDGLKSIMEVMQVLELKIGPTCNDFCLEANSRRIQQADRKMTDAAQEARRAILSTRKSLDQQDIDREGQLYGAGIAD